MNNLLSYCGLIDAKIRASDKDLPVLNGNKKKETDTETEKFIYYDCKRFRD